MALTGRDREILDFEAGWWLEPGPKEAAIRRRFELSATRYYEILQGLLDEPDALASHPLVIHRLRRRRTERRRARVDGSSGARQQR